MRTTKPLDEEKRRERDEPGTTGQDGSGDAGRNPDVERQHSDVGDKLGSRKIPNKTEDDEAANKSEFVPSGK